MVKEDKLTGMWKKGFGMGWFKEPTRHSLSAKGIKTGRKQKSSGGLFDIFGLGSSISDKSVTSKYPIAEGDVGSYDALALSGLVKPKQYDKVLEYRVWVHGDGEDYFKAFKTYDEAKKFSDSKKGAEKPLVLVSKGKKHIETVPDAIIGKKLSKEYQYKKPVSPFKVVEVSNGKKVVGKFKTLKEADKLRKEIYKKEEPENPYWILDKRGDIMSQEEYKEAGLKW